MLICKKCHRDLAESLAQQSLCEIEATLLVGSTQIKAHRSAMKAGPLCDTCLNQWQSTHFGDVRSSAIKALDEACLKLTLN